MAEKKRLNVVQIVCIAVGVVIGMVLFRGILGFSPIIGGALGGGLGAMLGMLLYSVVEMVRK